MSTFIFFIISAFAVLHFIYEAMVAPSIRLHLRMEFFKLRDKLRKLKFEGNTDLANEEIYDLLQGNINTCIKFLPSLDVKLFFHFYQIIRMDPGLEKSLKKKVAILDNCKTKEVRKLKSRYRRLNLMTFVSNNGMFFLPIIFTFMPVCFYLCLKIQIREFMHLSERKIVEIDPAIATAA